MTPILVTVLGGLVLISLAVLAGLSIWSRMIARRVEAAIPPAGEIATVTGGKIHFLDQGEGRPIVMIHGLAGHLQNFTHSTTDALKDDFRVIALDRPGSGYSARDSDEQARIPEQANIYLTVDIDGFDPSIAPGTGTPSHGGFLYYEVLELIAGVAARQNIVGIDLVEVAPDYDHSGTTSILAAQILLNTIGRILHR